MAITVVTTTIQTQTQERVYVADGSFAAAQTGTQMRTSGRNTKSTRSWQLPTGLHGAKTQKKRHHPHRRENVKCHSISFHTSLKTKKNFFKLN
jgi:hypothetical protein